MQRTQNVTLNQNVQVDGGLTTIPAGTTGTQLGDVDLLHGRAAATVTVDFGPLIGIHPVAYPTVDGPPRLEDLI